VGLPSVGLLQHFAFIIKHLLNTDRVIPANPWPHVMDAAIVFVLLRPLSQEWTAKHFFARDRANPKIGANFVNILHYVRPGFFPHCQVFIGCAAQPTTAIFQAAFSALSAFAHASSPNRQQPPFLRRLTRRRADMWKRCARQYPLVRHVLLC